MNQINSLNTVCIGAGILMTAVFFGIAIFYCLPNGYQNFWPALLFPLAIQGIVAFRLSSGIPVKQSLRWVPRVQVILGALIALSLGITIYFTFLVEKMKINEPYVLSLMYFVPWAIRISILLLITSGVLFILYTVNGHTKARWFLFADSTLLVVFFNFMYGLSNISTPYYGINVVGCSFFFAILPNLAATVLFLAQQKLHDYQRRSAWTVK